MKKKPRFFCDNCGYEVGSNVKSCPYCGRYFASVRCPRCDYSGPDKMFLNGCPMCGYSAPPGSEIDFNTPQKRPKKRKEHGYFHNEPLPTWALIASILGLILIIALLSYLITR